MKELTVEITNESGLHARPATAFTQLAAKFASKVTIAANGKTADAKSILTVLTLGATKGTSVTLTSCPAASGRKEHPPGSYAPSLLFTSRTEGSGRYLWHCRKRNCRRGHQKIYRIKGI